MVEYESNGPPVEAHAPMAIAHFGSGIWSYTRRTTGPIFKVTVPAIMIKSLCRGLGRKTPAPKRSMSNRPAPVAIISMAQHARPKVMGQSADLRAQLTTGAAISTVFAPTVRRIEFMIESTVVRTNPSSCSAIRPKYNSRPLERALPPRVVVSDNKNRNEHKHLDHGKLRKREVVAHENDGPGQQEDCFDVENEKQHRDDVIAHGKTL